MASQKKALLVGINYVGSSVELRGCINDINNVSTTLQSTFGYQSANMRILTDNTAVKPTRDAMIAGIQWLVSGNKYGDTLVFYYSGHGSQIKDTDSDELDGLDEVLVPVDYKTKGIIDDDWLYTNLVSKVPMGVTLYGFTDCCHSGTMCDMKYNYDSTSKLKTGTCRLNMPLVPSNWTDTYSFSVQPKNALFGNVVFLSGCQDTQTSADAYINNTSQGAFTYCFLAFLKANGKQKTKLLDVLKYLKCALQINGFSTQVPRLSTGKLSDTDSYFTL